MLTLGVVELLLSVSMLGVSGVGVVVADVREGLLIVLRLLLVVLWLLLVVLWLLRWSMVLRLLLLWIVLLRWRSLVVLLLGRSLKSIHILSAAAELADDTAEVEPDTVAVASSATAAGDTSPQISLSHMQSS